MLLRKQICATKLLLTRSRPMRPMRPTPIPSFRNYKHNLFVYWNRTPVNKFPPAQISKINASQSHVIPTHTPKKTEKPWMTVLQEDFSRITKGRRYEDLSEEEKDKYLEVNKKWAWVFQYAVDVATKEKENKLAAAKEEELLKRLEKEGKEENDKFEAEMEYLDKWTWILERFVKNMKEARAESKVCESEEKGPTLSDSEVEKWTWIYERFKAVELERRGGK